MNTTDGDRRTPLTHDFWRDGPVSELTNQDLDAAAHAAFAWYRDATARALDSCTVARLVALQREHLHRFPAGDLSAAADASPPRSCMN